MIEKEGHKLFKENLEKWSGSRYALFKSTFGKLSDFKTFAEHPEGVLIPVGSEGEWDDSTLEGATTVFFGDDERFWLYYHGHNQDNWRIGLAYSDDLITWTKEDTNPVLTNGPAGSWDEEAVADACVLQDVEGQYRMWYSGFDSETNAGVGYATSSDGVSWSKHEGNPVLTVPTKSAPTPEVFKLDDTWYMLYGQRKKAPKGNPWELRLATSPDGVNWTKKGVVVEPGGQNEWDRNGVTHARVVQYNGLLLMVYTGFMRREHHPRATGLALSLDGKNWVKYPGNPIFYHRDKTVGIEMAYPFIFQGDFNLFYNQSTGTQGVRLARSSFMGNSSKERYFKNDARGEWNNVSIDAGESTYGVPIPGLGKKSHLLHLRHRRDARNRGSGARFGLADLRHGKRGCEFLGVLHNDGSSEGDQNLL